MRPKLRVYQGQLTKSFVDPRIYAQLKSELRVLAKARPQEDLGENTPPTPSPPAAGFAKAKKELDQEDPESVYALRRQGRIWLKRQDALRADLRNATTKKDRFDIAKELMTVIQPKLDDIYNQIRAYKKTGKAPPHPDLEAMREEIAKEVCEYERLHNYAKRNTLTDEQKARLSDLRKKYNKVREDSYKKTK